MPDGNEMTERGTSRGVPVVFMKGKKMFKLKAVKIQKH